MAARYPLQASFARGQIGKKLQARADLDHYKTALKELINFQVIRQGGARRRPGTQYVATARSTLDTTRLLRFVFDRDEAYCIEMGYHATGGGYFRFYTNGGVVESSPGVPYQISHPYTSQQIAELDCDGTYDTIFFAHPDVAPKTLVRVSETDWRFGDYNFKNGPFGPLNTEEEAILDPGATNWGNLNFQFNVAALPYINNGAGLGAGDIGRWISIFQPDRTKPSFAKILNVTGQLTGIMRIEKIEKLKNPPVKTSLWRLGTWSTGAGWPSLVALFIERLAWGASDAQPTTLWFTRNGDLFDFGISEPMQSTDGISFTMSAASPIKWIAEADDLIYGTSQAARAIGAAERGLGFSAINVAHRKGRPGGAAPIRPIIMGSETIFVNAFRNALRAMSYVYEGDTYKSPEITILADDIYSAGISRLAAVHEPEASVVTAMDDGTIVCLSYEADQQLVAAAVWQLGGTDVEVLDICSIPEGAEDRLYLLVKRTVNGNTTRTIEALDPAFDHNDLTLEAHDGYFVDCGLTYEGVAATELSGFDHLRGETVSVMTDKGVHRQVEVSATGTVTLDWAVTKAHIGLGYESRLRTLEIPNQEDGTLRGRKRSAQQVIIDVLHSGYMEIGQESLTAERPYTRLESELMDTAPALRTGAFKVGIESSWENRGEIIVTIPANSPTPALIRAIAPVYEAEP